MDHKKGVAWHLSKEILAEDTARVYKMISIVLGAVCLGQGVAISTMLPLKTIETKYVRVDGITGIADTYSKLELQSTNAQKLLTETSLKGFVRWREEYLFDLQTNRDSAVALMTVPSENSKYQAIYSIDNPNSPFNVYKEKASVSVFFKTAAKLAENGSEQTWQVRFLKKVEYKGATTPPEVTHHQATITFSFSDQPLSDAEREINPLGFLVSNYSTVVEGAVRP